MQGASGSKRTSKEEAGESESVCGKAARERMGSLVSGGLRSSDGEVHAIGQLRHGPTFAGMLAATPATHWNCTLSK